MKGPNSEQAERGWYPGIATSFSADSETRELRWMRGRAASDSSSHLLNYPKFIPLRQKVMTTGSVTHFACTTAYGNVHSIIRHWLTTCRSSAWLFGTTAGSRQNRHLSLRNNAQDMLYWRDDYAQRTWRRDFAGPCWPWKGNTMLNFLKTATASSQAPSKYYLMSLFESRLQSWCRSLHLIVLASRF